MSANAEMIEYWNGEAGKRWAQLDNMMARLLAPIAEALIEHGDVGDYRSAVDVGCGGGSQSLLLAERLGPGASVTGVDISEPLLEVARQRAASAGNAARMEFVHADASQHSFAADSFDLLFSRFGVMFFDDPEGAFANLHRAMVPGGKLLFSCWQSMQDNPWVWLTVQAALEHLPPPPAPEPGEPGPFSFADPARVEAILTGAGFSDVAVDHHAVTMRWSEGSGLEENVERLLQIGPVSRLLMDQPEDVRARVSASVVDVLAPHYDGGALNLPGATWFVTARS